MVKEVWWATVHRVAKNVGHDFVAVGFPGCSASDESVCITGDPGSIPGSGRSAEEGIGYPLQYSWAFLVAQVVKNSPAMWETWVQSLGWEDLLGKGKATHSILWPGEFHGIAKSQTGLDDLHFDTENLPF